MPRSLNKSALKQHRDHLTMYRRFLPSLDLKRQQLISEYQQAKAVLANTEREVEVFLDAQTDLLALLGASEQDLSGLTTLETTGIHEQNLLGVRLPVLDELTFQRAEYSMLAKPFWVDRLIEVLEEMTRLRFRLNVERERVQMLNEAVRRITQRVNLFEKVLIPQSEEAIQRIRIYLADAERAAVVRSKIAKAKRQKKGRR